MATYRYPLEFPDLKDPVYLACPQCGSAQEVQYELDGAALICQNPYCPEAECPECNGSGYVYPGDIECWRCDGRGICL